VSETLVQLAFRDPLQDLRFPAGGPDHGSGVAPRKNRRVDSRVLDRQTRGRRDQEAAAPPLADVEVAQDRRGVEVLYLSRQLAGEPTGVECLDGHDVATARPQGRAERFDADADAGYRTQTRDDDAAIHGQSCQPACFLTTS